MKNTELKYYFAIVVVLALFLIAAYFSPDAGTLSAVVTAATALIAAVAFWLQLKRTECLDEANFIMNLNDQFISNDAMTEVEHALELYYRQEAEEGSKRSLNLVLDPEHIDRQRLINYLVYMEGFSALVQRNVMHLGVIDDLFAYRFFIAVNNPVVQKAEILPYANFYQGCFWLSEKWTVQWREAGRPIPLDEYALFECDKALMNVPAKNQARDE